jgi:hypothetical protein
MVNILSFVLKAPYSFNCTIPGIRVHSNFPYNTEFGEDLLDLAIVEIIKSFKLN